MNSGGGVRRLRKVEPRTQRLAGLRVASPTLDEFAAETPSAAALSPHLSG